MEPTTDPQAGPNGELPLEWECASCKQGKQRRLLFLVRDGEPPGDPGHCFVYKELGLYQCDKCERGFVARFDHDCGDWEDVWSSDDKFWLDAPAMRRLAAAAKQCPRPADPTCDCAAHTGVRQSLALPPWSWNQDFDVVARLTVGGNVRVKAANEAEPILYPDGKVRVRASVKDGLLHGKAERFHPNGQLAEEGEFFHGARSGTWKEYRESGELITSNTQATLAGSAPVGTPVAPPDLKQATLGCLSLIGWLVLILLGLVAFGVGAYYVIHWLAFRFIH